MGRTFSTPQQFNDVETGHFFMRVVFQRRDLAVNLAALQTGFHGDRGAVLGWTGRCANPRHPAAEMMLGWSRNPIIA